MAPLAVMKHAEAGEAWRNELYAINGGGKFINVLKGGFSSGAGKYVTRRPLKMVVVIRIE